MSNPKLMVLGTKEDFSSVEIEYLTALIQREFKKRKIVSKDFSFQMRIEYQVEARDEK